MTVGPFAFTALTPSSFLTRSAAVFRDRLAVIDGPVELTYREFHDRAQRLTGLLAEVGVGPGDRVAALCTNSHVMLELHQAVPMRSAVLVPLNFRLSAPELTHIVRHSGATVLFATAELLDTAREVAAELDIPLIGEGSGSEDYEARLDRSTPLPVAVQDEYGLLSINYTSGTTGFPKGVMFHHRGAYLQSLAMAYHCRLDSDSRYLWTLPMFHCHGWAFTWAIGAAGGTHVCLRAVDPTEIWRSLREDGITHFSGAPTVLTMIANTPAADGGIGSDRRIAVMTGGAPPSPTLLERMTALQMDVTHLYGLTETFGPWALNEWQSQWDGLDSADQARLKARQGVGNVIADRVRVVDSDGVDVPADGETMGEIAARGNDVMLGYYQDPEATAAATVDGEWMRTGDVGVMHPDGYLEIRDRSKDIIISGGENISSVEVERVIDSHPAVLESALVAAPDEKWGEIPVAYVTVRPDATVTADDIIEHVREHLARYKAPRRVVFRELPKTATGKIRKNELRQSASESSG